MNIWQRLWQGALGALRKVLSVFGPALRSWVAQEAAGYYQTVLGLVQEAESRGGTGQQKYDYVATNIRDRLAGRFRETPWRAIDLAIHLAVAEISAPRE